MMDTKPQVAKRTQSAQEQYPRKIGYIAHRLEDLKTAPKTKPESEQKPRVISDWASI